MILKMRRLKCTFPNGLYNKLTACLTCFWGCGSKWSQRNVNLGDSGRVQMAQAFPFLEPLRAWVKSRGVEEMSRERGCRLSGRG